MALPDPDGLVAMSGWMLYGLLFALPFVQEDAAVFGAAAASVSHPSEVTMIFAVVFIGLCCSDVWKYWLGWAATGHRWAMRFTMDPRVEKAGRLVTAHIGQTLLTARFVPGTRIPTYIACGFFRISYWLFCLWVGATAAFYIGSVFLLVHLLGEIASERAAFWFPVLALSALLSALGLRALRGWWRHRCQAHPAGQNVTSTRAGPPPMD